MPATPQPASGPLGPVWTPILQSAQMQKQKSANLAAAQQQGNLFDQYMNCVEVAGSNLNQIVVIGAYTFDPAEANGGVLVWTGIANGTAGRAVQTGLATGTLTVTKNSTAATLTATTSGTFSGSSHPIGAVDAVGNDVLTPGTTYTISGTAVTLSKVALESGTSLYCASAVFSIVT